MMDLDAPSPDGTLAVTTIAGAPARRPSALDCAPRAGGDRISSDSYFPDKRALAFCPDGRCCRRRDLVPVDLPSGRDIGVTGGAGPSRSLGFLARRQRPACGLATVTAFICDVAALTAGKLPELARRDGGRVGRLLGRSGQLATAASLPCRRPLSSPRGAAFLKRRPRNRCDALIDLDQDRLIKGLTTTTSRRGEAWPRALKAWGRLRDGRGAPGDDQTEEVRTSRTLLQSWDAPVEPPPSASR